MQDKYVGDVGDFGKYALLKAMQKEFGLSLGVVWYLVNPNDTDGEHQAKDGKHVGYLGLGISDNDDQVLRKKTNKDGQALEKCNPDLYKHLKSIVLAKKRFVQTIRDRNILGNSVVFVEKPISYKKLKPLERQKARYQWLEHAFTTTQKQGIVFLDPDNGLAPDERDGGAKLDAKYVLFCELKKFWGNGERVIVLYHHPNRKDKGVDHDDQIKRLAKELEAELKNSSVLPLRYRRGTSRAYFVIIPKVQAEEEKWKNWLHEFTKHWPEKSSKGERIRAFECKF